MLKAKNGVDDDILWGKIAKKLMIFIGNSLRKYYIEKNEC